MPCRVVRGVVVVQSHERHRRSEHPSTRLTLQGKKHGRSSQEMQAVAAPRVVQPPYAPELNPVEPFFRELRRVLEGRVYPTLRAKPERVRQLCG